MNKELADLMAAFKRPADHPDEILQGLIRRSPSLIRAVGEEAARNVCVYRTASGDVMAEIYGADEETTDKFAHLVAVMELDFNESFNKNIN